MHIYIIFATNNPKAYITVVGLLLLGCGLDIMNAMVRQDECQIAAPENSNASGAIHMLVESFTGLR